MRRRIWALVLMAIGCGPIEGELASVESAWTPGTVFRARYDFAEGYALVEVLDDDLIHTEYGAWGAPDPRRAIYASPMIASRDYDGPDFLDANGNRIETNDLVVEIDARSGCLNFTEKSRFKWISTICPAELARAWKGISINKADAENAYGLGQHFWTLSSADGDWASRGVKRTDGDFGNSFSGFWGGADPQLQFPILYVRGPRPTNYALLLDNVYKQEWSFTNDWWTARMYGDQVRFYFIAGPDLLDVRRDFMELSGRPPVPPKKAFGLWISEFGFDNWGEIDWKLGGLRDASFPVDGAFLDVQWFGGTWPNSPDSPMGRLDFEQSAFPDPNGKIRSHLDDHFGLVTIEESYVAKNRSGFRAMADNRWLVHNCDTDEQETEFWNWMGQVGMIDWSDDAGARWWHDNRRHPNLVNRGIMGHWTDLGEPERYNPNSCYVGVEPWKYRHSDIHNLYNLLWARSIYDGYFRHRFDSRARPWILSRAGTIGMQRYGAGLWSGDIASRLDVLATHMNSQLHMSFAGIDYYGSDAGGFWRTSGVGSEWEMYTQWFANSAWFDVPLRPHTYNCGFGWDGNVCPKEISPAWIGDQHSNRRNLRQRYELIPYYYSLAYRAHLFGEPVFPPVVMHYQDDPVVSSIGHEKLIGRDLLVGVVASHGEGSRSMYLPRGRWFNFHSNEFIDSRGQWTGALDVWPDGFRLPVFARAGAILPMMHVDDQTKDAFGHRKDGSVRDELIVKVFADSTPSSFTLYEDDGSTIDSWDDRRIVPRYRTRTTELRQEVNGSTATVVIAASQGDYDGAPRARNNELRWVSGRRVVRVRVDGAELPRLNSIADLERSDRGWVEERSEIRARSGRRGADETKTFELDF